MTVAETTRFTPVSRRNDILVRYLKPLIKAPLYQKSRKEIRSLLSLRKRSVFNLEAKLIELHELSVRYDKNMSDARNLFDVLCQIESKLGLSSRFINYMNGEQTKSGFIYMLQEHIESGFIASGEQVAPISLFLEPDKVLRVVEFINDSDAFQAQIEHMGSEDKQGHVILHPHNIVLG